MSTPQPGKIYGAICEIMKAVDAIAKGRRNQQQGYQFRGIDDVYNAMHGPLAEHGVFIVPNVLEREVREQPSKSGGILFYTTLKVSHRFYAADGSYVEAVTCGEAMDSGDKSTNKAMSAAMKYAILEVFAMPTEGDNDTENHTHEAAPRAPATPRQPTPAAPEGQKATNTAPAPEKPARTQGNSAGRAPKAPPAPKQADSNLSLTITESPAGLKYTSGTGAKGPWEKWAYESPAAGMMISTFEAPLGHMLDAAQEAGKQITIRYTQEDYKGTAYGRIAEIIEIDQA